MRIIFLSNRIAKLQNRIRDAFTLPERFKGTVVEKWAVYWRGLLSDYAEVATGMVKETSTNPRKVLYIGGAGYSLYALGQRNPDMEVFMRTLRCYSNNVAMVPKTLQNPTSVEYVRKLERALNENKLRLLSLGLFTLVWIDRFDTDDCTYPAICDYTRVSVWNFHERVVDLGCWNNFMMLDWKMRNYDANYI